jgi:hypothetical protein
MNEAISNVGPILHVHKTNYITKLCLWIKYSKILVYRCWQLLYIEVRSIVEDNIRSLNIYVAKINAKKSQYS